MDFKIFFFLASFSFLVWSSRAFNVTTMLEEYPSFSTFNNYLTLTSLAGNINSRKTITVLAVENGNMGALSGKSEEVIRRVMSVHIVLDYYDVKKFQNLEKKTTRLTTLFQSTGMASGDQGFLNATDMGGGTVAIGSAVKDSQLGSNLVSSVAHEGYDISILQVSSLIVPPGVESIPPSSSPPSPPPQGKSPSSAPAPATAPAPRKLLPPSNSPPSRSPPTPPPSDDASAPAEDSGTPAASPEAETDSPASVGTAREACLGIAMALIAANLFLYFML